jgi:predicted amidohydrolase YtcJ
MMEAAGLELSRRQFIKGAAGVGGLLALGGLAPSALGQSQTVQDGAKADAIYHGGPILTMVKDGDRAEALAVQNGRILAVGSLAEVMATKGTDTKTIDLGGKTLMPGFFDPHSHVVMQSAKFATANLDPKPIGEAGSIADIQRILREWMERTKVPPGKWVIGWGYDDTGIAEQRHPNRDDLDAVSTEHPILLVHISGHLMTGNSRMLAEVGITADTPDPAGGVIQRKPGSQEPNGVLEENAMYLVAKSLPAPTPEQAMKMIEDGLAYYAAAGITTAQDCATFKGTLNLLSAMDQAGRLPIDVIAWPMYKGVDDTVFESIVADRGKRGRLRLGGLKMTVDGSIQGYTAFLTEPYFKDPNSSPVPDKCDGERADRIFVSADDATAHSHSAPESSEGHRGYSSMTQEQVDAWIKRCDDNGVQVQVHTNGDAATDMVIKAVEKVRAERPRPDLRTTIIHAQTMRDDQLDFAAAHGLTPSFFPIHVWFWGDRHRDLFLGPERAVRVDPARSALNRNLKVTLHHDAPIAGIEMLKVAWAAVNRVTTSGKVLGPDERITPFEALRAITADAAWQSREEDRKGTLEAGKLADLVILSDDPLTVDPMKIKDIQVLQTVKQGVVVYSEIGGMS